MGIFMSQKTISMTLFTDCCTQNIFFPRESMCFHSSVFFFHSDSKWQIHVYFICKDIFTLKHASNFTRLALPSQLKFDDRPLENSDLLLFWIASKQIFLPDTNIIFAINLFQTMQFSVWKNFWKKKNCLFFFFKFHLFIDWPLYYCFFPLFACYHFFLGGGGSCYYSFMHCPN